MPELEIAIYTNIHGQRSYGLVLGHSTTGSGCVELLSDPFVEFPKASPDAMRARICWVTPVSAEHEGPGTRIYAYTGQSIAWQTPEIREILAAGPAAIEQRRSELYSKFYKSSYNQ